MNAIARTFTAPPFDPGNDEGQMQHWLADQFRSAGWSVYPEAPFKLQRQGKRHSRRMDLYVCPPRNHPHRMRLGAVAIEMKSDEHLADMIAAVEQAHECLLGFKYRKPGSDERLVRPNMALVACQESLGFRPESPSLMVLERVAWRMAGEVGVLRFDHESTTCWYERSDGDGVVLWGAR